MAVEQHVFKQLLKFAPGKILCLGYPDLLLNGDWEQAVDAEQIAAWHGWKGKLADTATTFATIGFEPTYIDIHASRGVERVVDLNEMLPVDLLGQFKIVLDPGTIEHCFNIGQAFRNLMDACEVGGYVIHTNPVNMINHGFWNISPTAYADLYDANGFECVEFSLVLGSVNKREIVPLLPHNRIVLPCEASSFIIYRKKQQLPFVFPMQWKYRQNPELKASA